jgi:hypothetical protein
MNFRLKRHFFDYNNEKSCLQGVFVKENKKYLGEYFIWVLWRKILQREFWIKDL